MVQRWKLIVRRLPCHMMLGVNRSPFFLLLLFVGLCDCNAAPLLAQTPPSFTQLIVFGDSFSDTGNVRDRTHDVTAGMVDFPGIVFNYSDGRYTNSDATSPASTSYDGVWHEQLARIFLGTSVATNSLAGGTDYAFGGATTENGTRQETVVITPMGEVSIVLDNMGKQIDDYFAEHAIDPGALYIVWGGTNDLLRDDSAMSVIETATRTTALVSRLVTAGAQSILVPNLMPLGDAPGIAPERVASLNTASANYRVELNADLDGLMSSLGWRGAPMIYRVDFWSTAIRFFSDPSHYGFSNTIGSAQGNPVNPDQFFFWDGIHPTTAGHYQFAKTANETITNPPAALAKALNIATRLFVDVGERVSIAGFIVTGDVSKKVIIRGIGPSLAASGVPTPLTDPALTLFDDTGSTILTNNDWRDSQEAEIIATGIPPQNDLESAIVATLPPGKYTAALAGRNDGIGNGLVEVYDLEPNNSSTLANLSTRGYVGTNDNVMIGSFIIGSGESPILVVRAIGPSLADAGIADPLPNPTIELHDGNGAVIGFNDNWGDTQVQAVRATQLVPTHDREATLVAPFLTPGNYTAIVRGEGETTGVALVEAYRLQ